MRCRITSFFCLAVLSRLALADVDVRQFGAIPDDGKDDTLAIQRAIDRAGKGQTITLPPGTFQIITPLDPRGEGRTIKGSTKLVWQGDQVVAQSQTILKYIGSGFVFHFTGQDLTL